METPQVITAAIAVVSLVIALVSLSRTGRLQRKQEELVSRQLEMLKAQDAMAAELRYTPLLSLGSRFFAWGPAVATIDKVSDPLPSDATLTLLIKEIERHPIGGKAVWSIDERYQRVHPNERLRWRGWGRRRRLQQTEILNRVLPNPRSARGRAAVHSHRFLGCSGSGGSGCVLNPA